MDHLVDPGQVGHDRAISYHPKQTTPTELAATREELLDVVEREWDVHLRQRDRRSVSG